MDREATQIIIFCQNMRSQYQIKTEQLLQLKLQVSVVQATIDKCSSSSNCVCPDKENIHLQEKAHGKDFDHLVYFTHQMEQLSSDLRSIRTEGSEEQRYQNYLHSRFKIATSDVSQTRTATSHRRTATSQIRTAPSQTGIATLQNSATLQTKTATLQSSVTSQKSASSVLKEEIVTSVKTLIDEDEKICRLKEEVENSINKANRQIAKIQASLCQSHDGGTATTDWAYMDNFVKRHLNVKRYPLKNRNQKQ